MKVGSYPAVRLRRMRQSPWVRRLVSSVSLSTSDFIFPIFVRESGTSPDIPLMPDQRRYLISELPGLIDRVAKVGIPCVALFPVLETHEKDENGTQAFVSDSLICRAIKAIKKHNPQIGILADVALDPYTSHGHDGLLIDGRIDNDRTLDALCLQAKVLAEAGADALGPSDMMDGRVGRIRKVLDSQGFTDTMIWSYAVKFSSHFYGPFRAALNNGGLQVLGDKKTYHMDPTNPSQILAEVCQDLEEGADAIIVKPGILCLDVIKEISNFTKTPIFSYQVSGEYAMLKLGEKSGIILEHEGMVECLLAQKRSGATAIITYAALELGEFYGRAIRP
jgi:porphobilinogen synthase